MKIPSLMYKAHHSVSKVGWFVYYWNLGVLVKRRNPILTYFYSTKISIRRRAYYFYPFDPLYKIPTRNAPKCKKPRLEFDSKDNSLLLVSTDQRQSTFFFFLKHVGDEMRWPMQPSRIMPPWVPHSNVFELEPHLPRRLPHFLPRDDEATTAVAPPHTVTPPPPTLPPQLFTDTGPIHLPVPPPQSGSPEFAQQK